MDQMAKPREKKEKLLIYHISHAFTVAVNFSHKRTPKSVHL